MKTITFVEDVDGYPAGAKEGSRRESYKRGDTREVSAAFADLMVGKGHAKEVPARVPVAAAPVDDSASKGKAK